MRGLSRMIVGFGVAAAALGIGVGGARAEVSPLAVDCTGPGQDVSVSVVPAAFGWSAAKRDAANSGGYPAVISSAEMYTCVQTHLVDLGYGDVGTFWIGGSDGNGPREGRWTWVEGTSFWSGAADGSSVDGAFESWSASEPNDFGGREDCLEWGPRGWNDQNCRKAQFYILMIDN